MSLSGIIDKELDAAGLVCPEPVMLLHRSLQEIEEGCLLKLTATDPTTRRDVRDFCHHLGHQLLAAEEINGIFSYIIRKKSASANIDETTPKKQQENTKADSHKQTTAKAIFAAGCFWHIQDLFHKMNGVKKTIAGYTGGVTENPTYEEVCAGNSGHAEAVLVEYDPRQLTYAQLLDAFWQCHNPTQLNRQGADIGSQYRSAIFYCSDAQREEAEKSKNRLDTSDSYKAPIVTHITAAAPFYAAEEYHQMYLHKKRQH